MDEREKGKLNIASVPTLGIFTLFVTELIRKSTYGDLEKHIAK